MKRCGPSEELSQGYCYGTCSQGYTGVGPMCFKNCPEGYFDVGSACAKPSLSRPNGQAPKLSSCAPGFRDDGNHCWADQKCAYVKNENNQTVLSCSGCGCIRQSKQERQTCSSGFELQNGLCYPKCYAGYTSVGTKCVANCPSGFTDLGSTCVKPTISRLAKSMHANGLKTVTDDPRKSTLAFRSQLSQSQEAANKTKSFASVIGSSDVFTATYAKIVSSSPNLSSTFKTIQDSVGNSVFYWILLIVGSVIAIGYVPGGSAILGGIGSAITSTFAAAQSAVTGAVQIAKDAADTAKTVVSDVATVATEAAKPVIEAVGTGLDTAVNIASQQTAETVGALTS